MKNIKKLGNVLSKKEQESINGGLKQCLCGTGVCHEYAWYCSEPQCRISL